MRFAYTRFLTKVRRLSRQVARSIASRFQTERLDFLVNSAGIGVQAPFAGTTESQFDEPVSIHLKALAMAKVVWKSGWEVLNARVLR